MPLGLLHLVPSGGFRPIQPMTIVVGGAVIIRPSSVELRVKSISRVGGHSVVLKGKV
jgi:hypothetical protein